MKYNVELDAADMLLDAGVSLPLLINLPFKKEPVVIMRLIMKRPFLGTQIRISRLFLQMNVSVEEVSKMTQIEQCALMAIHGRKLSMMIAYTILRGPFAPLPASILAVILRWFVPVTYLSSAFTRFIGMMNLSPFMDIITSSHLMNPMKPMMSHKVKGS